LISSIADGGLKLQDIDNEIKSLKVKWIEKIMDKEMHAPWKSYFSSFFKQDICKLPYFNLEYKDYPTMKDEFYKSMLATWSELHFQNPSDELEILKQPLWYNSLVRIGDKPVWYDNWQKKQHKIC
jgi:hypothetical protein